MMLFEPWFLLAPLVQAGGGPAVTSVNTIRDRLNPLRVSHVLGLLVVLSTQMFR